MADKCSQMVLSALSRAVADPEGLPLHGGRAAPGLFPATTGGKQAAQRCLDEGYLRPVEASSVKPRCVITDKGCSYLLAQVSPRQVLEDFVRVLEAREAQFDFLLSAVREARAGLDGLKANAEQVLQHVLRAEKPASLSARFNTFRNDGTAADAAILARLAQWRDSGVPELAFAIGGAEGLDRPVLDRATAVLSLGPMTWPHRLVRGMLLEQLYRAQQILAGHPYHRT